MAEPAVSNDTWTANRGTYLRDHVLMALLGGIATSGILYWLGNASWWVGFVAAPMAIAVRGWYLASEELALVWHLTDQAVVGSQGKQIPLSQIEKVRRLGSAVQLVTRSGDKHLMKYLADPDAVRDRIATVAKAAP